MVTSLPMELPASVRLIATATPAFTATAPPPMEAATAVALVVPVVLTLISSVTLLMVGAPLMAAWALPSKLATPAEAFTATAPPEAEMLVVSTLPKFISDSTFSFLAPVTLPAISLDTSEKTCRTATLTPTPTNPPEAITEMRRTLELSSTFSSSLALSLFALIRLLLICLSEPEAGSFSTSAAPVRPASEPEAALTVITLPALSVAFSATLASTLEFSTATVTPTPTPAVPPTATVPEIISALSRSPERTVMSLAAVTLLPVPMVALTPSFRTLPL